MEEKYTKNIKKIKALSDSNRLKIIDILSCGEKCACKILDDFDFTQPTLSHHMKVLVECGLVNVRKEGLWNHYSLNDEKCSDFLQFFKELVTDTEECICKDEIDSNSK